MTCHVRRRSKIYVFSALLRNTRLNIHSTAFGFRSKMETTFLDQSTVQLAKNRNHYRSLTKSRLWMACCFGLESYRVVRKATAGRTTNYTRVAQVLCTHALIMQ